MPRHLIMTSARSTFRTDINGLRAWAVVPVVLFHFGVPGFAGGFIGVDVFFVISGYLMTRIIVQRLEQPLRPFSLWDFYLARARRILPALLVLCGVLLALGWRLLPATEYRALGAETVAALGFVSNLLFWQQAGYFDSDSHDKLLLHTWSLSLEWQFYLLLPLALLGAWHLRPGRRALTLLIVAGTALSLLLCVLATPIKTSAAFYLLPTRAWELFAGGAAFLLAERLRFSPNASRVLEQLGLALVLAAVLVFSADSPWPGWRALVPVCGAVLVLLAARDASPWTGSRLAQWLGDSSYSLYLWHWPLAVALVYLDLYGEPLAMLAAISLSLVCGALSYRLVERPFRLGLARLPHAPSAAALASSALLVAVLAWSVQERNGVPGRLAPEIDAVFAEAEDANPRRAECLRNEFSHVPECTYGGERLGVIVIGDSHAGALVRAIERSLPSPSLHVLDWTMSNCPTIAGVRAVNQLTYQCGNFVRGKLETVDPALGNAPLIIINRTSYYLFGPNEPDRTREIPVPNLYLERPFPRRDDAYLQAMRDGIVDTACRFARQRPVYMLRPLPELKLDVPRTMGRALLQGRHVAVTLSQREYRLRNELAWEAQDLAAERCGVKILDPLPYLCPDGRCQGDREGLPVYSDDDHVNERGGNLLVPLFQTMFEPTPSALRATAQNGPAEP